MDLISPSLLAKLYPEALQEMPRVVLFRHGGVDRVKRRNFHREEVPKSKPLKKFKLSVPKDKEIDGNLWTTQWKWLLVNSLYLKIPLQASNGPCQTLLLGEMGKTLEIKSMTHF